MSTARVRLTSIPTALMAWPILLITLLLSGWCASAWSASDTLTVEFITPNVGQNGYDGSYTAPVACWLTTTGGAYVTTLGYWGNNSNGSLSALTKWKAAIGGTTPTAMKIGATQSGSGNTTVISEIITNRDISTVANATYVVHFEIGDGQEASSTCPFNKNGTSFARTAQTVTKVSGTNPFTSVFLTYTATSANTMTANTNPPASVTVGTAVSPVPTVIIKNGSVAQAGVSVMFTLSSQSGTLGSTTAITNASGIATPTSWTIGTKAQACTLTASSTSLTSVVWNVTSTASAAKTVTANGTLAASATVATAVTPAVIVTDVYGNPVSGAQVTFAVTSGGGSVTGTQPVTTGANGIATVSGWTLGAVAGTNTLTATVNGLTPVTFTVTGTAGTAATITMKDASGNTSALNNQSATVLNPVALDPSVFIADSHGNPVSARSVTFTVASGGGTINGGLTTTTVTSNASGIATLTDWTLGAGAGSNTLTATSTGLTGSPITFTATAVAASTNSLTKTSGDTQTGVVNTQLSLPLIVTLTSGGNPVIGTAITFVVKSGGGSLSPASPITTDGNGKAQVNWTLGTTAGAQSVTASGVGLTAVTFTATATPGAAASVAMNSLNSQSAVAGSAVGSKPSVIVKDQFTNVVTSGSVTFAVLTGGGSITGAQPVTISNLGIATVGNWTLGNAVGSNTLRATVTGNGITGNPITFTATAIAGPAATMVKTSVDNQTVISGKAVTVAPSVTVTDSHGNPVSGVIVTFTPSGAGSLTGMGANNTDITDALGVASVGSWTLDTVAGSNTLTVSATGLTSVVFNATGTPGAAASIVINAGDGQSAVAGTALTTVPSVLVTDLNNNPVAGTPVTFAVGLGGGTLTGASTTTNASGIASVGSWTMGAGSGTNTLVVTANDLSNAPLIGSPLTFTATATADSSVSAKFTMTFTTTAPNNGYAPKNVVAVWIERQDGSFVKTIGNWSGERRNCLSAWNGQAGTTDTDSIMGATRVNHSDALTVTWDLIPRGGSAPVTDGRYVVKIEVADNEPGKGANVSTSTTFNVTSGVVQPLGPIGLAGIKNLTINTTPVSNGASAGADPSGCGAGSVNALLLLCGLLIMGLRRTRS